MSLTTRTVELPGRTQAVLAAMVAVGAVVAVWGAVQSPDRLWANWLLVSFYLLTLALGGLCFVALHYASGATWGVAIRRVPEALAALVPLGALAVAVVFFARPQLYPWMADGWARSGNMHALAFKHAWLSRDFFLARAAGYILIWTLFAWAIRRQSRLQDSEPGLAHMMANRRLSAVFLALFAVTFSLASFDWVMSLEPAWFSTIYGVYHFAGLILTTVAVIVLLLVWLERTGPLAGVLHDGHFRDLGKLFFSFSTFWAYIWFCQYMLIWYANIPEETVYFVARTRGGWFPLFLLNAGLNWVVPFIVLIRRDAKRQRTTMAWVAVSVLVGRWLDLYLMILPPIDGAGPAVGVWSVGMLVGGVGVFGLVLLRALKGSLIVPAGDPELASSLHFHHE